MEYVFTLKYQLADPDCDMDALLERLEDAGCDDALVGIGRPGRLALEFSREADSAEEALHSALADAKKAIPSAKLIEASPDFVGLTDIAEIVGISRQAMRKLVLAHRKTFPIPVHEGSVSIWHLAEVLAWLESRGDYPFHSRILEAAKAALEINLLKEADRHLVKNWRGMKRLTA